jgi:hypothetical protein
VSAPAPRWAVSPSDLDAHLLSEGQHPAGALKARCAALLPVMATQYPQPPGPRLCPICWVIFAQLRTPPSSPRAQEQDFGRPAGP